MRRFMAVVAFFLGLTVAHSDVWGNDTLVLSSRFWSTYVGSGGALQHEKPVLQSDLQFLFPKGFYGGITHFMGLDGTGLSSDTRDEIDYTLGWSGHVLNFTVDVGVMYIDLVDIFRFQRSDVILPAIEISKDFKINNSHAVSPFLRTEMPLFANGAFDGGALVIGGMKHSWQLTPLVTLQHKDALIADTGVLGADSGFLGHYAALLNWQPASFASIEAPSIKVYAPFTKMNDGRKTEFVIGLGVVFRF